MPTPKQTVSGPPVPPPRHKMALLSWAGAWTLITLILWVLGPAMVTWPLLLRTLLLSVLMVVGMTWIVMPYLTRIFAGWLAPTPPAANRQHRDHRGRPRPSRVLSSTC
jgi:antibiotic biosynthesis monooxygenase (ABM) superfamily enzyme